MESRLKAAVIGCGRMGAFTSDVMRAHAPACWFPLSHADAIVAHPALTLAAFADSDVVAARRAAAAFGIGAFFDDPDRLLADIRPDIVTLATRTVGRADLIQRCIHGAVRALHVEKPLCNSMAEWHALHESLSSDAAFVTYGALRRHLPVYRAALTLAQSGEFGELREVRVQFGAGSLFWTQTHAIDLLLFAAAGRRLVGVQALLDGAVPGRHAHELENDPVVVSATLLFEGGLTGVVTRALGSDFVLGCVQAEIAVRGDGGVAELLRCREGAIYPTVEPLSLQLPDGGGGTLAPLSQLVDCLQGVPGAATANRALRADMLQGQRVAFAMFQSHVEGSRLLAPEAVADDIVIHARAGGRHA